jgi:hypothetical protein
MVEKLKEKLVRFLSIVGGFSSPEDIARAKRRSSPTPTETEKKESDTETAADDGSVK